MVPYTYLVIHKTTGNFYYGVRTAHTTDPNNDIGILYFTSSKTINAIVEAEGANSFVWIVRKQFPDKQSAILWEYRVIRRMLNHPKCLNRGLSPKNVPGNWFTNGTRNILGRYCPYGYSPGRIKIPSDGYRRADELSKRAKWWNLNDKEVHCEFAPSSYWAPGRLRVSVSTFTGATLKGRQWWNDGTKNHRGNKPIGDNWVQGRIKFICTKKRAPISQERKKQQSNMLKGRKLWNNGLVTIMAIIPPPGFVLGRLPTKRP